MDGPKPRPLTILMADDDADDRLMTERALRDHVDDIQLRFVEDGQQLLDYLHRRHDYNAPGAAPRPALVLLDLNMPRKDGREALSEIKSDPTLRCIPVLVFTTSTADDDVRRSYQLGVNSYITKPASYSRLVETLGLIQRYWLGAVRLPAQLDTRCDQCGA